MSTVFSRRSFLKYTAVAAVAVAGTSLLGGCSGAEVSVCTEVGENASNTVLKVKSTLTKVDFKAAGDTADVTFYLHIANTGRKNPIDVGNRNFVAYADDAIYMGQGGIFVSLQPGSASGPQIKRGEEADYLIQIKNVPADVQQLTLIFMPDSADYDEYQARWILTPEKFNPTSGTTEQPDEGSQD